MMNPCCLLLSYLVLSYATSGCVLYQYNTTDCIGGADTRVVQLNTCTEIDISGSSYNIRVRSDKRMYWFPKQNDCPTSSEYGSWRNGQCAAVHMLHDADDNEDDSHDDDNRLNNLRASPSPSGGKQSFAVCCDDLSPAECGRIGSAPGRSDDDDDDSPVWLVAVIIIIGLLVFCSCVLGTAAAIIAKKKKTSKLKNEHAHKGFTKDGVPTPPYGIIAQPPLPYDGSHQGQRSSYTSPPPTPANSQGAPLISVLPPTQETDYIMVGRGQPIMYLPEPVIIAPTEIPTVIGTYSSSPLTHVASTVHIHPSDPLSTFMSHNTSMSTPPDFVPPTVVAPTTGASPLQELSQRTSFDPSSILAPTQQQTAEALRLSH